MTTPWRLPGYVIGARIGAGGSGEVWSARAAASGDPVALKRIPIADTDDLRAARAEAALLATLDHPHLVRLHETVPNADSLVLVLDLAAGGSLADLLAARDRLTPGETITALAPIAAALAYAHTCGVVHGDVSPANILFTDFGLPLLADLGVARLVGDTTAARCTPAYADPAVASGSAPGPLSDVFMLGGVALHALTGLPTWTGPTAREALAAAAHSDLDVTQRLADAGVPAAMADVVSRALTREPHRRGTAAEFALELRHSGHPIAVELHAGRCGPAGSSDVADDIRAGGDGGPAGASDRLPGRGEPQSARPAFDRPSLRPAEETASGSPALTRGVRAHPVRTHAAPRRAGRLRAAWPGLRTRLPGRRRWSAIGLALALAACGAVLVWPSAAGHTTGHSDNTGPTTLGTGMLGPAAAHSPAPSTVPSSTRVPPPLGATALRALRQLDRARAAAYAQRRPAQLATVYADAALRAADSKQLTDTVPAGCGLDGVRTVFGDASVERAGRAELVVVVTATLRPSRLVCGRSLRAKVAGTDPRRMRFVLGRTASGYRVISEGAV